MKNKNFLFPTLLASGAMIISGTNNFITKIAVSAVKDPILFTAIKNSLVAILLIGIVVGFKKWPEIKGLTKKQIGGLLAIGGIGGALAFALFFTGLSETSAINGSLIHKTLFLWVLLFAAPILKEYFTLWQWVGVGSLFAANIFVGGFTGFLLNRGELLILCATMLWAVENIIAKKMLADLSALTVVSARMVLGSIFLLLFLLSQGRVDPIANISAVAWGWTILTSVLLFGYVLLWYSALKRAPATYVASLLVPATMITNALSAVYVTHTWTTAQTISTILSLVGFALVILFSRSRAFHYGRHITVQ
ncbi:MAG: DMT family transporter [Candidatus Paceibacterota bacterium]|jgi:drug/metabolite transporter (DMT)-like permease|nr:DMT family transporter [Candidatus Paceibacterota bacterium]